MQNIVFIVVLKLKSSKWKQAFALCHFHSMGFLKVTVGLDRTVIWLGQWCLTWKVAIYCILYYMFVICPGLPQSTQCILHTPDTFYTLCYMLHNLEHCILQTFAKNACSLYVMYSGWLGGCKGTSINYFDPLCFRSMFSTVCVFS